jgi:hypothetical protein
MKPPQKFPSEKLPRDFRLCQKYRILIGRRDQYLGENKPPTWICFAETVEQALSKLEKRIAELEAESRAKEVEKMTDNDVLIKEVLDKFAQEAEYKDWADLERSEFMWYPDTHERLAALAVSETRKEMIAKLEAMIRDDDTMAENHVSETEYAFELLERLKKEHGQGV